MRSAHDLLSAPLRARWAQAWFAPVAASLAAAVATAAAVTGTGCTMGRDAAVPLVRVHAARDLDCPDEDIRIERELSGYFKAVGCGRKARYRAACEGLKCVVSEEGGPAIPWRDRPDPSPDPSDAR